MLKITLSLTLHQLGERKSILYSSIISFLLAFLCYGRTLFSAYSSDDYVANAIHIPYAFYLQQGRFAQGTISFLINRINISATSSGFLFEILFFASLSLAASYFLYLLSNKYNSIYTLIFASALIVANPIFSTLVIFHLTAANFTFAFLCLSSFFCFANYFFKTQKYKYLIYAAIAICLMCGAYQPCLPIAIIWCLFYAFFQNKTYNIQKLCPFFLPIIIGVILYIILFAITKDMAGPNDWDNRVGMLPITKIHQRLHDIIYFIPSIIWREWWIIPASFTCLLSLMLLLIFTNGFILSLKKYLLIFILLICSIIIVIFPASIIKVWEPSQRALLGYAFCYGLALIFINNNSIIKKLLYSLSTIAILYGAIISNGYLAKTELENIHDQWIVSNITMDLLKHANGKNIAIVNNDTIKSMNWSYRGLFYTYTGSKFNINPVTQQDIILCKDSPKWPNDGYLHITNEQLTLCLK